MSRQNYYKTRKVRKRKSVDESLVGELVRQERAIQPRLGGLKLHYMLKRELEEAGVPMGRDRFFEVLKNKDLLLERRSKAPKTTNSRHSLPLFENLIKDLTPGQANEIWVSDITYIRISDAFAYLSLITDKCSRKIVGWHLGRTMTTEDTLEALDMALCELPKGITPIHHSDRGCQYCSHEYVNRLKSAGLTISMTEVDHCAENALAERVNGILKDEYFLDVCFGSFGEAKKAVEEAIKCYNNRRPHRSLSMKTPVQVHAKAA
jgi:putative transposase